MVAEPLSDLGRHPFSLWLRPRQPERAVLPAADSDTFPSTIPFAWLAPDDNVPSTDSDIMTEVGKGGWRCPRAANPLSASCEALLGSIPSPASLNGHPPSESG